uniref:hypothetical protein n=1 Tax=Staphylococcus epidermidis TaxID=1282 RepID=UPI0016430FE9
INAEPRPVMGNDEIESVVNEVKESKDNLDGDEKLEKGEEDGSNELKYLRNVKNCEREREDDEIKCGGSRSEVCNDLNDGKGVNEGMGEVEN